MNFIEITAGNKTHKFYTGDTLKIIGKGKSYAHKRADGEKIGTVPLDVVSSLLGGGQLELILKWPIKYKVVKAVKKNPAVTLTYINPIQEHLQCGGVKTINYPSDRFEQAKEHWIEMLGFPYKYKNPKSSYKFNLKRN